MTELPSRDAIRDDFIDLGARSGPVEQIVAAYRVGRLVDREAIDVEAAARWTHAEMVLRGPTDLTWEAAYPEEQADHLFLALGAIAAALGDDLTVEELRAAAFKLVDTVIGDSDDTG